MDDAMHDAMGDAMDDDPALRALGADLAREDPRLAALLTGAPRASHRQPAWLLLIVPVLAAAVLLPLQTVLGVTVILIVAASPLAVLWLCSAADEVRPPRHP
jgi:hypothetical protein